jgi:hypothetical protein
MSLGGRKKIYSFLHSETGNNNLHSSTFWAFRHKDVNFDVKCDSFYNLDGSCCTIYIFMFNNIPWYIAAGVPDE